MVNSFFYSFQSSSHAQSLKMYSLNTFFSPDSKLVNSSTPQNELVIVNVQRLQPLELICRSRIFVKLLSTQVQISVTGDRSLSDSFYVVLCRSSSRISHCAFQLPLLSFSSPLKNISCRFLDEWKLVRNQLPLLSSSIFIGNGSPADCDGVISCRFFHSLDEYKSL